MKYALLLFLAFTARAGCLTHATAPQTTRDAYARATVNADGSVTLEGGVTKGRTWLISISYQTPSGTRQDCFTSTERVLRRTYTPCTSEATRIWVRVTVGTKSCEASVTQ